MKKIIFTCVVLSFSSLVAAASNDIMKKPNPQAGEQQPKPTFTLSKGYFSLFNILTMPVEKTDTTKVTTTPVTATPNQEKKKQ